MENTKCMMLKNVKRYWLFKWKALKIGIWDDLCFDSFVFAEDTTALPRNTKPTSFESVKTDIVLSKGGPEAIAKSFYNSMRAQQQSGGQSNENLARRTKLNWYLPPLKKCDGIIREGIRLYFTGDGVLKPHWSLYVHSSRADKYMVSKVVNRLDAELGRCPFLAND